MSTKPLVIQQASHCLKQGGIIAYPTESLFGLGCDPFNQQSVMRLLELKKRPIEKGLILVAANWQQIEELILPLPEQRLKLIKDSWPGFVTWLLPCTDKIPSWIHGQHQTVAIRISANPLIQQLCLDCQQPLVSTSANQHGQPALYDAQSIETVFANGIDYILQGEIELAGKASEIRDGLTGEIIRAA